MSDNDPNLEKLYITNRMEPVQLEDIIAIYRPGSNKRLGAGKLTDVKTIMCPPYTSTTNSSVQLYNSTSTVALTAASNTVIGSATLTLGVAGTYLIVAEVVVNYNAATFAAVRDVTFKLRRTNNSSADVANSTRVIKTDIVTTKTGTFMHLTIVAPYTVTTAGAVLGTADTVSLIGQVSTLPTAGSLDVVNVQMNAFRLQT